jgi:hypothetical protein
VTRSGAVQAVVGLLSVAGAAIGAVRLAPDGAPTVPATKVVVTETVARDAVTPRQEAAAAQLVTETRTRLARWLDVRVAEADGWVSSGDAFTGFEHFVHWDWINDTTWLDPKRPESLVYTPQPDGSKKLVAAMFMLPSRIDIEDAPRPGGALMQWHKHDDLCYSMATGVPILAAQTDANGDCPPGTVYLGPPASMLHVWLEPNECGPFASIEGSAGGQVEPGEERLCDHDHASA